MFQTKVIEFEGDVREYHWFDLRLRCKDQVKIILNFLNGTL